jgi:hypothetical protein
MDKVLSKKFNTNDRQNPCLLTSHTLYVNGYNNVTHYPKGFLKHIK